MLFNGEIITQVEQKKINVGIRSTDTLVREVDQDIVRRL